MAVQNPLTTLPESVGSAERVLARQDGPTVLVGRSFSGVIVTQAGLHPCWGLREASRDDGCARYQPCKRRI
jgi:hypothetical protein